MKRFNSITGFLLVTLVLFSCSKNDNGNPSETQNNPPEAFDLIGVTDNAVSVDVTPIFSWQAATDPDGDTVSYDLYLGTQTEPSMLYAENINGTSYTVQDRLLLITDYYWKVVANDGQGGESESVVNSFTTRNLNIPDTLNWLLLSRPYKRTARVVGLECYSSHALHHLALYPL